MPRKILVTGAGGGLGRAIAVQMARDGDDVVGTVRGADRARTLTDEAASQGLSLRYEPLELTAPECRQVLVDALGPVDVLVNNAGFGIYGALEEVSDDRAAQQIAVNLTAPLALTRALLPGLRETRGCVVWIGSLGGRFALPFQSHYSATKAAIAATSDALRMELKPLGVRVTCIEPGDFSTGFTDARDWGEDPGGAYAKASGRCREAVERTERNEGEDPVVVARRVSRLSRMSNPPARRPVGRWARTLVFVQRLLPDWLRERLVAGTYGQ
jgi:short-subunit dehydrogenase